MTQPEEFPGVPGLFGTGDTGGAGGTVGTVGTGGARDARGSHRPGDGAPGTVPPPSDFFAVAAVSYAAGVSSPSDGDLWPSAWADDGALYAACGDGLGFSDGPWSDLVINRVDGDPRTGLTGQRLAAGREVAPVWTDPERFNSKPTGMVAVDGDGDGRDELYLAVQDLRCGASPDTFNTAPAAGVVCSRDYGRTWTAPERAMFTDEFTTIMFLDFGQSNRRAAVLRATAGTVGPGEPDPAAFVYAYGLDHNWRTSYSGVVPDPQDLYLARVPAASVLDRSTWEFFAGTGPDDVPTFSSVLTDRVPVLTDTRRVGTAVPVPMAPAPVPGSVLAQGGIVYNPGLDRYLYSSWTEFTFEFYESPTPWGPWRPFLSHDFGPFPWSGPRSAEPRHGGYATTIPSKFLSEDGRDAWVQSNWFVGASTHGGSSYHFSLRPLRLDPMPRTDPAALAARTAPPARGADTVSEPDAGNLATAPGVRAIATACRSGRIEVLNDGSTDRAEDSWNGLRKDAEYWGYTWPEPVRIERLEFTSGPHDYGAGWFDAPPRVQVRRGADWVEVPAVVEPPYPADWTATGTRTYTFTVPAQISTGVRLGGRAGGWAGYTSVSELAVYGEGARIAP
ncbi:DUF4185 domain-containing protein [Occultella glacieicola]|uniref:DUF4185 domain-containing protein n=1 Tax=Occultella glacieicola TaxID=2518684 RepID=A0ABY2DZ54_9MICO|nr:DUF4185 domain-containing protein [Occultella glacieicola]TDE89635.1 DUF4185 domain-containing protein [Occultella glacieicola]